MTETSLLVVGAGPYVLATAAHPKARGIDTVVVGHPMGFWRDNMPAEMFLRSGPDWHLDAGGVHTLEAFLQARGIASREVDPLPISLFLDYADWFRASQALEVREELVASLHAPDGRFEAVLESGERVTAEAVVAAPGIRHFTNLPAWASSVPEQRRDHTCDLVRFDALAGARVLVVGGRQSAYEQAIAAPRLHVDADKQPPVLLCEPGVDTRLLEPDYVIRRFESRDMFWATGHGASRCRSTR